MPDKIRLTIAAHLGNIEKRLGRSPLGKGLPVHQLEKLNRYETHLDRKFERTLAMLVKLKELRENH